MAKKRANGEGSIRKRSDGRWEGRYTAGYHPETGKRIIKNVLGKTQAECKAKLSAALESVKGIDVSRADEYTVATWLRSWYDIYAKPNIRVATADRYHLMVEQYTIPRIGNIKLTKLTAHDLQKLYKELMENGRIDRKSGHGNPGLSSTTVRSLHLMLHNAFERAVKERLILRNPTEDCIAPKIQKFEMQILQPEHIKEYLDAANARGLLPMFYLELVSGLRKGELTALLWSDLDIQNRTISVSKQYVKNPNGELALTRPKTETSVRKVSIPQEAVDLLVAEHNMKKVSPFQFSVKNCIYRKALSITGETSTVLFRHLPIPIRLLSSMLLSGGFKKRSTSSQSFSYPVTCPKCLYRTSWPLWSIFTTKCLICTAFTNYAKPWMYPAVHSIIIFSVVQIVANMNPRRLSSY